MGGLDEVLAGTDGFEWDAGNSDQSWRRHMVREAEAEQALLNRPLLVQADLEHSQLEPRYVALGKTEAGRGLTIVFTVRGTRIRLISARPMSASERKIYAEAQTSTEEDS